MTVYMFNGLTPGLACSEEAPPLPQIKAMQFTVPAVVAFCFPAVQAH